ncbi:MAG: hypothetical protein WCP21_09100, partial [Armatimonadota bacterium]
GAFVVDDARLVCLHRLHYSMIRKGATQVQVERVMGPPYSDMHDGSGRVYHNWSLTHWDWGERDPAHNVKWYAEVEFDGEGRVVHKEGSFCTFD